MSGGHHWLDYAWRVVATALCFVTFGLSCIFSSLVVFPLIRITSPGPDTTRRRVRQFLHHYYRFSIGLWRALGVVTYELHGGGRLAAPGQLVVANHPSLVDAVFLGALMPQVDCIVKDALMRNPFLRAPVRWAGYILNSSPERLIEDCATALRAGESLLVFPEGTRSTPGQPLKMQRGAAHIALATGHDLLPVTLRCHPRWLAKTDQWFRVPPRRPHWSLTVGEPIRLAGLTVPGESRSVAARRVTAHLVEYFDARRGPSTPAVAAAPVATATARRPANSATAT